MDREVLISHFINDAFDYSKELDECAINNSVSQYLLEFIANGFVKYKTVDNFFEHIDEWLRSVINVFKEIKFNRDTKQLHAVIDLKDQFVQIDDHLLEALRYVIDIQTKYGLIIKYTSTRLNLNKQTTLFHFFKDIEKSYPKVLDRYKGLGSSSAEVSKQTIMDKNTRRVIQVSAKDVDTFNKLAMLVGDGDVNMKGRKEALLNFKFNISMIDN